MKHREDLPKSDIGKTPCRTFWKEEKKWNQGAEVPQLFLAVAIAQVPLWSCARSAAPRAPMI